jgi:hypothetical protein
MDGTHFDTLVRSFARSGTRRRLLTGLPLLGALTAVGEDEATAQRPINRVQQRNNNKKKNDNNNNNNNNKNNGGGGGGVGTPTPTPTCSCCIAPQVYWPGPNLCCALGQVPIDGACCPRDHICNTNQRNQGQLVCCQHPCLGDVCCPCDNVANCQACVVDVGQNPPASCQTYCAAGQICTPGGCAALVT